MSGAGSSLQTMVSALLVLRSAVSGLISGINTLATGLGSIPSKGSSLMVVSSSGNNSSSSAGQIKNSINSQYKTILQYKCAQFAIVKKLVS
jgi:hypothetical protein